MRRQFIPSAAVLAALAFVAVSCTVSTDGVAPVPTSAPAATPDTPAPAGSIALKGAGSTFVYPLYSTLIDAFDRRTATARVRYEATGSGDGIKQILARTVDFGASDAAMSDTDLASARGEILHIPTVLGAVALTYNLDGVSSGLRLDGPTIADVYEGKITTWDDPRIVGLNPGVPLPHASIAVAARLDGSGTTAIFTDYLSKVSASWKEGVGSGTSVQWPTGFTGKGNEGVAAAVKRTPGSIGYVELGYAVRNALPYASIKNVSGEYVAPTAESVMAAAAGVAASMPADLRVSVTNASGAGAYPIAGFTYLLVYREQDDAERGKALAEFVWWVLGDGQQLARSTSYVPLAPEVLDRARARARNALVARYRPHPLTG